MKLAVDAEKILPALFELLGVFHEQVVVSPFEVLTQIFFVATSAKNVAIHSYGRDDAFASGVANNENVGANEVLADIKVVDFGAIVADADHDNSEVMIVAEQRLIVIAGHQVDVDGSHLYVVFDASLQLEHTIVINFGHQDGRFAAQGNYFFGGNNCFHTDFLPLKVRTTLFSGLFVGCDGFRKPYDYYIKF